MPKGLYVPARTRDTGVAMLLATAATILPDIHMGRISSVVPHATHENLKNPVVFRDNIGLKWDARVALVEERIKKAWQAYLPNESPMHPSDFPGFTGNLMSHIYYGLNQPGSTLVNWVGLYWLKDIRPSRECDGIVEHPHIPRGAATHELVLGAFQGKPAKQRLPQPAGVCAESVREGRMIVVEDVHKHPSHVACDSDSSAELCIPIVSPSSNQVVGVLDMDSPMVGTFTGRSLAYFQALATALGAVYDAVVFCSPCHTQVYPVTQQQNTGSFVHNGYCPGCVH